MQGHERPGNLRFGCTKNIPLLFGKMNTYNTMNGWQRHVVQQDARSKAATKTVSATKDRTVGLGACGLDTLALVSSFPKPDDKIRTESSLTQGGGNCANALTAASRLGLATLIISKIGCDPAGHAILQELEHDGVDTELLLHVESSPSPSTYIIVDRAGSTRTCIHSPGDALTAADITSERLDLALGEHTALVYLDGRHPEAALKLAHAADERGIPLLVEAERPRVGLEELLPLATYISTNSSFPQVWTRAPDLLSALEEMIMRLPRARHIVTTLGSRGCVAVRRNIPEGKEGNENHGPARKLSSLNLQELWAQLDNVDNPCCLACIAPSGARIMAPSIATQSVELPAGDTGTFFICQASSFDKPVVDTTGAGDAFLGAMLWSIVHNLDLAPALRLSSVVAACKCLALGSRTGMPRMSDLDPAFVGTLS